MATYNKETFKRLFQYKFNLSKWQMLLQDYFHEFSLPFAFLKRARQPVKLSTTPRMIYREVKSINKPIYGPQHERTSRITTTAFTPVRSVLRVKNR